VVPRAKAPKHQSTDNKISYLCYRLLQADIVVLKPITFNGANGCQNLFMLFNSQQLIATNLILFYFILFYFILFYFILFYFILFYFILFYFILFYFILFY
jgi:hypothetical protein